MNATVHGLERYDHGLLHYLKQNRYSAVYVVGHEDGPPHPVKIGIAEDLKSRMGSIQTGNWLPLKLFGHWWTAGTPLSRRVEKACHEFFIEAGRQVRGEWFDVRPEVAVKAIENMAASLKIELMTQDHMIARTKRNAGKGYIGLYNEQQAKHAARYVP